MGKAINGYSFETIENLFRERQKWQKELEATRRNYAWWKSLFDDPAAQQELLDQITAKGNKINGKLAEIPQFPTLRELATEDEVLTLENIQLLILWLTDQINVPGMDADQIEYLAADMLAAYGTLRIEDIMLCFRNAIRGKYGKLYNRIDAAIVHDWITQYQLKIMADRAEMAERRYRSFK